MLDILQRTGSKLWYNIDQNVRAHSKQLLSAVDGANGDVTDAARSFKPKLN